MALIALSQVHFIVSRGPEWHGAKVHPMKLPTGMPLR
jgi:hypothetical protein